MSRTKLLVVLWLCLTQISVMTARAEEPAPAKTWQPRRFPPLHPQPRAAAPQRRDVERAPHVEAPERRRHTGLIIAGVTVFFSSWLVAAVAGSIVTSINRADCKASGLRCDAGSRMAIPLVGPFIANRELGEELLLGGPQILGVLLIVGGFFHFASRPVRVHERARLDVFPVLLPTGGTLSVVLTL